MRTIPKVARQFVDDGLDDTQRALDPIRDRLNQLVDVGIVKGRPVSVALPNATAVRVKHRLGRPWAGWLVADLTGPAATGRIERVTTGAQDPKTEIVLMATGYGATITVGLWVF